MDPPESLRYQIGRIGSISRGDDCRSVESAVQSNMYWQAFDRGMTSMS